MSAVLYLAGIIVFITSVIVGISTLGFIGLIFGLVGGVISSVLFFGLARVLDKQDDILVYLQSQDKKVSNLANLAPKTKCPRCEKEHDTDCSSCPHCAFKPGR